MAKWILALCLVLLVGTTFGKRGGSKRGGSKSKSSSSSGSSVPANSYPKQQWAPKDQSGDSKKASAPPNPSNQNPGHPAYPSNQNPSYPAYPNNHAPPAYSPPGHPYPAPPSYSAPGHPYQAPPAYPGQGYPSVPHGYPSVPHGYPSVPHGYPSVPHGYPSVPHGVPQVPVSPGHVKGPKSGIGKNIAAGAVGVVAGAAMAKAHNKMFKGPKIKIGGHYHGGYYHDGYSSSEEYFDPYITNHNHRFRDPSDPERVLTDEEVQLIQLSRLIERLCDKLRQPSVCTLLKMYGLKPLMDPRIFLNGSGHFPTNMTGFEDNSLLFMHNGTGHFNHTMFPQENRLVPISLDRPEHPTTPQPPKNDTSSQAPVLSEDRLKAAEDLFKVLE